MTAGERDEGSGEKPDDDPAIVNALALPVSCTGSSVDWYQRLVRSLLWSPCSSSRPISDSRRTRRKKPWLFSTGMGWEIWLFGDNLEI